jgi:hypothetical protein
MLVEMVEMLGCLLGGGGGGFRRRLGTYRMG